MVSSKKTGKLVQFYPLFFFVYEFDELRGCIRVPDKDSMEEVLRLLEVANEKDNAGARLKPATLADFINHYSAGA